jgi:hypothetical protein
MQWSQTFIVSHDKFRYATSFGINARSTTDQRVDPLEEPVLAGQVERCVPITIRDERISIGFEKILDNFVLPSYNS